ncbi:MAG: hypothetical protein AAFV53_26535 [Myxococcota bacterium]
MKKLMILALVLLTGCYTTKINFAPAAAAGQGATFKTLQHTFIYGLVSPGAVNAGAMCGGNPPIRVKSQVAGLGILANYITVGLWVPMTVTVTCGSGNPRAMLDTEEAVVPDLVQAD